MKQQYIDFFSYYSAVLHGADGFVYSDNCGLGFNMLGFWSYYLTSPFLIVFALVPMKYHVTVVTYLICAKISAISLTSWIFFVESGDKKDDVVSQRSALLCSMAFSLSGFIIANMTNIMWLDAIIVLPVVLLFLRRLMRGEKKAFWGYSISVMALIYGNYYIATMILFFTGVFMVLLLVFRAIDLKKFGRYILGTVTGIALDSWLLIPTMLSLLGTNKDHAGISKEAFSTYLPKSEGTGRYLGLFDIVPKLFSMNYDSMEIMDGMPNIYFGTVLIVPVILFFLCKTIDKKKKSIAGSFMLILMLFMCIKPLNTLAHGGTEAYGYLYRYSFLFSFGATILAYMVLTHMEGLDKKAVITAAVMASALVGIYVAAKPRFYLTKIAMVNAGLIAISIALCWIWHKLEVEKNSTVKLVVMVQLMFGLILAAELSLNFVKVYRSSSINAETVTGYRARCDMMQQALSDIEDAGNDQYRTESVVDDSPNESLHYGYRSATTYNSLLKVEDRMLMYRMGFNDNGLYTVYDFGNTRTADALLGIKYVLTDGSAAPEPGQEMLSPNVIENEYVLSANEINGANARELLLEIEENDKNSENGENPFEVQRLLLEKFTKKSAEVFIPSKLKQKTESDEKCITYSTVAAADGEMYFYLKRDRLVERCMEVFANDEFISYYGNASCQKVIDLGMHHAGDIVKLEIKIDDGGNLPDEPVVVTESIDELAGAVESAE